jgi:hypothetical protein
MVENERIPPIPPDLARASFETVTSVAAVSARLESIFMWVVKVISLKPSRAPSLFEGVRLTEGCTRPDVMAITQMAVFNINQLVIDKTDDVVGRRHRLID